MFYLSEKIKRSALEDLIDFLIYHPQAAKFLPSLLKAYKENKNRLKQLDLNNDPILNQICKILSNELVVKENRFKKILRLSKEEVRSRLKYLVGKYPDSFSIDRLDNENWVIYITKEGLINA